MPNIPKIVHDRLKVPVSAVGDHPEANLLSAFSEKSLPEREHAAVLEHLARCGECREIVALALPESEAADQIIKYPTRPWFTWPTLRWGFITAGLAAVTLFGVMQYQHRSASQMVSDRFSSPPATEARNGSQPMPAAREEAKESENVRDKAQPEVDTRTSNTTAARASDRLIRRDQAHATPTADLAKSGVRAYAARNLPHGPMLANQQQIGIQQQNANQSVNQVAQAPSALPFPNSLTTKQNAAPKTASRSAMEANSEIVQVEAQPAAPAGAPTIVSGLMVKNEPLPPPSPQSGHDETKIDRAKPAFSGTALKSLPDSDASQLQGGSKALAAGNLRWTINSAGRLQRSADQGTTWQEVQVNSGNGYAGAAGFEVVASSSTKAKDSGKFDQKSTDKKASALPVFRTVAANGLDVWAGGSAGLLFHSIDAGVTWTRIAPASAGAVLTGDILSMEFRGTQNGRISTSTGETWTTADAGQTWQKQ